MGQTNNYQLNSIEELMDVNIENHTHRYLMAYNLNKVLKLFIKFIKKLINLS